MITFLISLLLINGISANNCQQFLTMKGEAQEMSVMLCIKDNSHELSHTNTNLSIANLSNYTNNNTNYHNNSTNDMIDLNSHEKLNKTNSSIIPEDNTTSIESPPITTPSPITELPTEPSTTEPPTTEPSTEPAKNLRGSKQNTTNNSNYNTNVIADQTLETTLITVIIICCGLTAVAISGFIWIYCKHKQKSIIPENESKKVTKIKRRRVSPELPKDLMIEKVSQDLQYTNKYRYSSKLKKASTTIDAVNRLQKARENRSKRSPFPPGMKAHGPKLPPPSLPPPAPSIAMKQAKRQLERKNRNSWSIKEIPTNKKEIATDTILKTNASLDLAQKD